LITQFFANLANVRFQDGVDILFLTVVAYHLYLWFRGTKAFKALLGLFILGVIFTLSRALGLFLTTWVFQVFWQVLVILLIILFQSEIRQVLERVDPLKAFGLRRYSLPEKWMQSFAETMFHLASQKTGALMIIEQGDRVDEFITAGHPLEGEPNNELILSILQKQSPLHDGAVVIREDLIVRVACYLPLSSSSELPTHWGTRHRAAIGLSERCDAIVVVVSEERGDVSLVRGGRVIHQETPATLAKALREAAASQRPSDKTLREKARFAFTHCWPLKAGTLCLVTVLWFLLAGQQDVEVTLSVPLAGKNLPGELRMVEPLKPEVRIKVRGLRKDASLLNGKNVRAQIDLSLAESGHKEYPISRDHIMLPNERVQVVRIEPSRMAFRFERKLP
jgi:uncharacterized protein (TIGR00159 family)